MSALSSGFEGAENFYKVVPPVPGDLRRDPFIGACYRQKSDICWFPDRGTTTWIVTGIQGDIITIQPNTGSNRARWQRPLRRLPREILRTEYRFCRAQRQYPPC